MPLPPDPNSLDAYRLQWWLGGEMVAEVLTRETSDGFAFICEQCDHKMWAAKYFPNRAMLKVYVNCPAHPLNPRPREIVGSLILWWSDELERMPPALVAREYELHLAHYLKEIQNDEAQSGDTREAGTPLTRPHRTDAGRSPLGGGSNLEGPNLRGAAAG